MSGKIFGRRRLDAHGTLDAERVGPGRRIDEQGGDREDDDDRDDGKDIEHRAGPRGVENHTLCQSGAGAFAPLAVVRPVARS